ncbi:MAG TPA: VWA domain-containing protein [Gemmataceae bacterium]|nr:VWA domain-containing protein [Gemmataceae bacterium]
MAAKIHVERMMHRSSIAVSGESAAAYALVKLIPSGLGQVSKPMGLNLALALDMSGSMYDEDGTNIPRLKRVQDAAIAAVQKLKPEDTITVVGFAGNALVVLPPTKLAEKDKIESAIRNIEMCEIDPNGTTMNVGMRLAIEEVEKLAGPGRLSQIIVLTDGETDGVQECRELALRAAKNKIHLTMIGIGIDWRASLLKELAKVSEGKWLYIDGNNAAEAERVFVEEFEQLSATAFMNVEMHLRPMKDIKIKRVRQVVPEIKEMTTTEPEERHLVAAIGTLQKDQSARFVLDMSLPKRPDGKYVIAQMEITYDLGLGTRETTGPIPLEMTYTAAQQGYANAEVMKHIDEVQIFELNNNLQKAIQSDNKEEVQKVAQQIEQKGQLMGPRAAKKTMLARQVLQELNAGGRVSKKTQLAMEDSARMAEEMPAS